MIVAQGTYEAVAAGGSHVVHWQSRKRRVEILNPLEIRNENTGEVQEREGYFEAFNVSAVDDDGVVRPVGCPAPVDTLKTFQYRDKKSRKKVGNLLVVVTSAVPYVGDDGRPMWMIVFERVGTPHRPIPADQSGVYLAHSHGYTSSASQALDSEAPTIPDKSTLEVIAEDRRRAAEERRRKLLDAKRRAEAVAARIAAELAELDAA